MKTCTDSLPLKNTLSDYHINESEGSLYHNN